ncbi:alpha/beta fold hydrolase [Nocardioides sp.]|uniref:bifunctional alpha/beta hydrolase/OsmC family protein n=1 Tax=Nocardioides sp. TaxID=35761 RepID=UPI00356673B4
MSSTKVEFPGSQDASLAGRLDLPDGQVRAMALFAHCFTCGKDVVAASRIAKALNARGIGVLRFDFTGLGSSEGDFAHTNFTSNIEDLRRAADFLRERHTAPTLLIGHSLGGAAVLATAAHVPEARAVVTIAAPADTDHLVHLLSDSLDDIEAAGEAEVCLADRPFRIQRQFLDDLADQPQAERIRNLGRALLVMHSPTDETVDVDNARRIFEAARHPKSFVSVDGANHLLTGPADARFAADVIAAWVERYLDADDSPASGEVEDGSVVVAETSVGHLTQRITVGGHELVADEPTPLGDDTGPSPYDLVLAGLGACTSMTLRMYADRKQWPLERVTVSLNHSRIHAEDCADCETRTGHLDHVERTITLEGDLDDDQRERLLSIADKCPVHRTLNSEVVIATTLVTP